MISGRVLREAHMAPLPRFCLCQVDRSARKRHLIVAAAFCILGISGGWNSILLAFGNRFFMFRYNGIVGLGSNLVEKCLTVVPRHAQ